MEKKRDNSISSANNHEEEDVKKISKVIHNLYYPFSSFYVI